MRMSNCRLRLSIFCAVNLSRKNTVLDLVGDAVQPTESRLFASFSFCLVPRVEKKGLHNEVQL